MELVDLSFVRNVDDDVCFVICVRTDRRSLVHVNCVAADVSWLNLLILLWSLIHLDALLARMVRHVLLHLHDW